MDRFHSTLPDRLDTPRLTLRWPRLDDAPFLVPLLGEWEVARWLANVPFPFTIDDARNWVRLADSCRLEGRVMVLVVARLSDDRPIGGAELSLVRHETGYWIGIPYQRQGYGRETIEALTRAAFETFGFPGLGAATLPDNQPSRQLLEKAGFEMTGIEPFDFGLRGGILPGSIYHMDHAAWTARRERPA